jgi:hypothetical protein
MDSKLRALARRCNLCIASPDLLIACLEDYREWLRVEAVYGAILDPTQPRLVRYQEQLFQLLEALDGRGD